ncbi:uncharacterized protein LOC125940392 [Dermacentor silvarum]|uniref:uncharacterized protein LOC125940392 n=1 Tax=Dermacentor silvarum TaxID=543639 RepID=UPI0021010DD6|nr:uncharacterized protein LOC125940392 [Dermacentor silvarum]
MIFVILVSVFTIGAADFDYHGRPTFADVLKFYKPGQITYLVKRTYMVKMNGEDPTCIHNKVESVKQTTVHLSQGYTHQYKNVQYPVKVTVSTYTTTDEAPSLTAVRTDNKTVNRVYYFHFYDPVAQCAVLTFKDYSGVLRCELHTWKEKAYYYYYGNCQEEYDYQCPGRTSHSVYLKYCPHIK